MKPVGSTLELLMSVLPIENIVKGEKSKEFPLKSIKYKNKRHIATTY